MDDEISRVLLDRVSKAYPYATRKTLLGYGVSRHDPEMLDFQYSLDKIFFIDVISYPLRHSVPDTYLRCLGLIPIRDLRCIQPCLITLNPYLCHWLMKPEFSFNLLPSTTHPDCALNLPISAQVSLRSRFLIFSRSEKDFLTQLMKIQASHWR